MLVGDAEAHVRFAVGFELSRVIVSCSGLGLVPDLQGACDGEAIDIDPVSWTPDYAGFRVGRRPSWAVRVSIRSRFVETLWSW